MEKSSRYFLNKEKRKATKKTIKNLEVSSGERVSDIQSILKHVKDFYAQLFPKEEVDQSLIDYFFKDLKSLTQDQGKLCEGILSKPECQKALFDMKNGKSQGIDGLPKEFYCIFWNFLGDSFVNMANSCFKNNSLSASQKLGVISLIYKNQEKAHLLNYWRPVTLLCVDYKIISKSLTNHLKKVMGNLISIDQTAAVPGRSILDNVHLLRNVLDYSSKSN